MKVEDGLNIKSLDSERPAESLEFDIANKRRIERVLDKGSNSRNGAEETYKHRETGGEGTTTARRKSRFSEKSSFKLYKSKWLHVSHCQINTQGVSAPSNSFQHF